MRELISIVIPVYNKEPYLLECLESVRHQDYEDIEVILVDDGSTDGSSDICCNFCEKDKRFQYVFQENSGQSAARLTGVEKARGNWIMFVDADDCVAPNICRLLMTNIKETKADFVIGGMQNFIGNELLEKNTSIEGIYTPKEILEVGFTIGDSIVLKSYSYVPTVVCATLFKKENILGAFHNVDMRIRNGEDAAFWFFVLFEAEKISFVKNIVYYYRRVENSASKLHNTEGVLQFKLLGSYLKKLFVKKNIWTQYGNVVYAWISRNLCFAGMEYFADFSGIFPFFEGDYTGRVAIYGAGTFGVEFYTKMNKVNIVGWFDKNYNFYQKAGYSVRKPEEIKEIEFDYLLITIYRESTAVEVFNYLKNNIGVRKPIFIVSYDILNSDYTRHKIEKMLNE